MWFLYLLYHFVVLSQVVNGLPTIFTERSIRLNPVKRWESGPELGGVNFPDPCILRVGSTWYSFATRTIGSNIHIQIASSPDFHTWEIVKDGYNQRDALPNLPSWVYDRSPNTWAPDVSLLDDGTFIMYYSATTKANTAQHCTGAAISNNILGPYIPVGDEPLICPSSEGGAIDASGYHDRGQRYIVYKIDGNSQGHGGACGNDVAPYVGTPIVLQPVASDGISFTGSPTTLIDNNGASDMGIVEAPSIGKVGNTFVLFFSSGCFAAGNYTVSYATSDNVNGPYARNSRPLFQSGDYGLSAPGGADIDHDGRHLVFHANSPNGQGRSLYEATLQA